MYFTEQTHVYHDSESVNSRLQLVLSATDGGELERRYQQCRLQSFSLRQNVDIITMPFLERIRNKSAFTQPCDPSNMACNVDMVRKYNIKLH